MKKSSLILMTSALISLPICSMELAKKQAPSNIADQLSHQKELSPNAKQCLEIMNPPRINNYPEWESLLCYYGGDKEGFVDSEKCAELVDNFINTTSQENCTVGLQVAVSTPNLPIPLTHKTTRSELIKKLIARRADTKPALQYLTQTITLYGPDYQKSSFVKIFNILSDAKAFDQEALTSFKDAQEVLTEIVAKLEANKPK